MSAKRKRGSERPVGFGGEKLPPAGDSHDNPEALRLFLDAVSRLVPTCALDLVRIADDVPKRYGIGDDALNAWAAQWGFTSPKLIRIARATAASIRLSRARAAQLGVPVSPDPAGWFPGWTVTSSYFVPDLPTMANPSWNPIEETRAAFLARASNYADRIETLTADLPAAVQKRAVQHFDWLVLHHVDGRTYDAIAELYQDDEGNPNPPAVSRGVTEAAALVGLVLRTARGRKFR